VDADEFHTGVYYGQVVQNFCAETLAVEVVSMKTNGISAGHLAKHSLPPYRMANGVVDGQTSHLEVALFQNGVVPGHDSHIFLLIYGFYGGHTETQSFLPESKEVPSGHSPQVWVALIHTDIVLQGGQVLILRLPYDNYDNGRADGQFETQVEVYMSQIGRSFGQGWHVADSLL
jgi:hypothetical protein